MSMTVLITGAGGYVGGRIVHRLSRGTDISLRAGVNLQTKAPPPWLDDASLIHLDITSSESLAVACRGVDSIVHLAAVNENICALDPELALLVNGLGTLKLIRAAEQAGVSRFVYFSTAHVYGAPLSGVITERSLTRPVHPYAITHRVAEDFVLAAHDRKAITGIVLRLSNSFGAPADPSVDRWTLLINDLCRQTVTTRLMSLKTSGLQYRDFITLEDVARAVEHFLFLPSDLAGDGLFNLGGDAAFMVIEIAEAIAGRCHALFGYTPEIRRPEPVSNGTQDGLLFCIDKLKDTGFRPLGGIESEIDATLELCNKAFGRTATTSLNE